MGEEKSGGFKAKLEAARRRYPWLDHVLAMNEHYGKVQGNVLAGAVTYFGFLSFFPILAIAFAVVGYVSARFPDARENLITAIEQLFPGIVSEDGAPGTISLQQIENSSAAAGLIGFVTLLYTGLGWVSGQRQALETAFVVPASAKRKFLPGKAIDLGALVAIGFFLILSVAIAGSVTTVADNMLDVVNLDETALGGPILWVLGVVLGLAASTVLFMAMFRLLGHPDLPARALWQGALLGAVGFEALKLIVVTVLGSVGGSPFAPLAVAITLVVWINYFSRLVFYGASWAVTSRRGHDLRSRDRAEAAVAVADSDPAVLARPVEPAQAKGGASTSPRGRFDAGSAVIGAVAGFVTARLLRRRP